MKERRVDEEWVTDSPTVEVIPWLQTEGFQ